MASNPLIAQGTLNRLRGSVTVPGNTSLNVTASYLGKAGIRISLQGGATLNLPQMTGVVTSQEPYMAVEITMALLKSQSLSDLYKQQMELSSLIGDITVRPDTTTLGVYQFYNCSIMDVPELSFAGDDASYPVKIGGYYNINSSMWNL